MTKKLWYLATVSFVLVAVGQGLTWADAGPEHQVLQVPPVQLGTSGGSVEHIDAMWCCSGTLGGLLQDETGNLYVLSNNHVIARVNRGVAGEDIIQPGLIDTSCGRQTYNIVADLTEYIPIDFGATNLVDAAIARIRDGQVDAGGVILDIGPLSPETLDAFVGLNVQKSGRTTGQTFGQVAAVDVTVAVSYTKRCGSPRVVVATFDDQFRITPGDFSDAGDSGSLIVEDVPSNPRAVGLLFAGSPTSTIANPIQSVLCGFSFPLAMVAGTSPCEPEPINDPPLVSITTPADGSTFGSGATIDFTGTASDTEDGNLTGNLTWISNIDGQIGTGGGFSATLTDGAHNISASVTDSGGATGSASVSITIGPASPPPATGSITGTVTSLSDVSPIQGATVRLDTGQSAKTDALGSYIITDVPAGTRSVRASAKGFKKSETRTVAVQAGQTVVVDFGLEPRLKGRQAAMNRARNVKARHGAKLLEIPDVVGHGISLSAAGTPVIEIYLANENATARAKAPAALDGVPVRVVVTGLFEAF